MKIKERKGFLSEKTYGFQVMDTKELARYLGLNVQTVTRMAERGEIPAFKIGNRWRFRIDKIEQWMRQKTETETFVVKVNSLWENLRKKAEASGYSDKDVPDLIVKVRRERKEGKSTEMAEWMKLLWEKLSEEGEVVGKKKADVVT